LHGPSALADILVNDPGLNISALFKKGSKQDPENYRLVPFTSLPGKIMETIVKEYIVAYFNKKNWLSVSQHGFV